MWLFTKHGFFSATSFSDEDSTEPEIQIRARAKEDLQNLIEHFLDPKKDDILIYEWENRDYPYRVIITQARWVEVSAQLAAEIDYSNFKDKVKETQGYERAHEYMNVWSAMYNLEDKLKRAKEPKGTGLWPQDGAYVADQEWWKNLGAEVTPNPASKAPKAKKAKKGKGGKKGPKAGKGKVA